MVILPSTPGSTVYLTAKMSPRMVFAACGADMLTRLGVTPSLPASGAAWCGCGSPTKRPVPSRTVVLVLGDLSSSGVPPAREVPADGGGSFAPRCTASSERASGAGDQESEYAASSVVVWHADTASANAQSNPRQGRDRDCKLSPLTNARLTPSPCRLRPAPSAGQFAQSDRKSTRLNSSTFRNL